MFEFHSERPTRVSLKGIVVWVVALLFVLPLCAIAKDGPVRLALIVEGSAAAKEADLLTVELSKRSNLELLERNQIDKVYREQQLSAANSDYLKLGQILGADGLLIMELVSGDSGQFLNLRLIAVKTGLLLKSERFPWPIEKGSQWATGVVAHIQSLLPKLSVTVADAVPVSIVSISSPVQTVESRELQRQLAFLTPERLTREPQLFVLERRRMQWLSEEKQLKGLDDTNFWSGSYLLSMVIDRDGYSLGNITLNATLAPPNGGTPLPIEVHGNRTNLTEVVNRLAESITTKLKLNSTNTSWLALEEAKRFSEEADWFLRRKMFEEAQSASESAWALGLRNPQLAATRIRSYTEPLTPPGSGGNDSIHVLAVPVPGQIQTATRALELFNQDAPSVFTSPADTEPEWNALGIQTLREVSGLLEGYYLAAEARSGHEDELSNLRTLARRAAGILHGYIFDPGELRPYEGPYYGGIRRLEWGEGGMWFDKAEDAAAMFHQLVEEGYPPDKLPRLVGWTWKERKQVPDLMTRLLQQYLNSTNPTVQLEGLFLDLCKTPAESSAVLRAKQDELLARIWENRQQVWTSPGSASLLWRTMDVLKERYKTSAYKPNSNIDSFARSAHRIRKDYLLNMIANPWAYDEEIFENLFPNRNLESPEEAGELLPMVQELRKKADYRFVRILNWRIAQFRSESGNSRTVLAKSKSPDAALRTGPMLTARFINWKLQRPEVPPGLVPEVANCKLRFGKLWCCLRYHYPQRVPYVSPPDQCFVYTAIDPATGNSLEIPFSAQFGVPDGQFEVTSDSLYVCVQDHLQRYRFKEQRWENIAVPATELKQIIVSGTRLYLTTSDSVLEFVPDSREFHILASSRRRPALNELDSMQGNGWSTYAGRDGNLGVVVANRIFNFSPTAGTWSSVDVGFNTHSWGKRFNFDGEFQFLVTVGWERLLEFKTGATNVTVLLAPKPRQPFFQPPPNIQSMKPLWNWPDAFTLENCLVAGNGKKLRMLALRRVRDFTSRNEEPVKFEDARDATLLYFEPEFSQALSLPVRFEKIEGADDPFKLGFSGSRFSNPEQVPFWFTISSGQMYINPEHAGHWLLSIQDEETGLEILRNKLRAETSQNDQSIVISNLQTGGKP